jgi:hypothetical protein
MKLAKFKTALQLVDMASQEGGNEEKLRLLEEDIVKLIEEQP